MTALVSVAAGNASNSATWSPPQVPTAGDTLTVQHDVVFDQNMTVGHAPATGDPTAAISGQLGGKITIAANVELTIRGDLLCNRCQVVQQAGSIVSMDPTAAADPTNAAYRITLGLTQPDSVNNIWIANGTASQPCTLRTIGAGSQSAAFVQWGVTSSNQMNCTFFDLKRIERSDGNSWVSGASAAGEIMNWSGGVVDDCGTVTVAFGSAEQQVLLEDLRIINPRQTNAIRIPADVATTTGTRAIRNNMINGETDLSSAMNCDFSGNICNGRVKMAGVNADASVTFDDNYIIQTGQQVTCTVQNANKNITFIVTDLNNPHGWNQAAAADANLEWSENIFQVVGSATDSEGDMIITTNTVSARTHTCRHNVILPSTSGGMSGTLLTTFTVNTNCRVVAHHNTVYNGGPNFKRGITVGEGPGDGGTDRVEARDNAFYAMGANGGIKVGAAGATNTDICLSGNLRNNGGHNQDAGSNGGGYDGFTFSSGTPGGNDVNEDPQFVQAGAGVLEFDTDKGGPGTWANFLTEILKFNTADFNPAYSQSSFRQFIIAKHAPQNQNYKGAASDGSDIGAIPVLTPQTAVGNLPLLGGRNPMLS